MAEDEKSLLKDNGSTEEEGDGGFNRSGDKKTVRLSGGPKISGKAWGRVWCKICYMPFPVFFIVWNEFCERFSYYGMRAVLTLFLRNFLGFDDNSSTAIYHAFIVLCYLMPVVGAIISDSCLGKYGTIVSLSILYAVGNVMMSISAIPFDDDRVANKVLSFLALFVIAFGTGGIKPCVAAFGGDQFLERHMDMLPVFFSVFYFSINFGSFLSTVITPILRNDVQCFGDDNCFPLAFGVPAVLMIFSLIVFIIGTRWYIINKPKREASAIFFIVPFSVCYAIYRRIRYGKISGTKNLMSYATPRFSEQFSQDVWLFLRIVVMLLPLFVFWALFDQQGSRWTLQALRMDGRLGSLVIQPDQVQSLNPVLILIFIPLFESVVYPLAAKVNLLNKPLQRMVLGMFIAGLAFVIAGIVEIHLQNNLDDLQSGESRALFINGQPEQLDFNISGLNKSFNLTYGKEYSFKTSDLGNYTVDITGRNDPELSVSHTFPLNSQHVVQLIVSQNEDGDLIVSQNDTKEFYPIGSIANVKVYTGNIDTDSITGPLNFTLCAGNCSHDDTTLYKLPGAVDSNEWTDDREIPTGRYNLMAVTPDNQTIYFTVEYTFEPGGVYTLLIVLNSTTNELTETVVLNNLPNQVSIFLQVPMYVTITAGEVLFSITGLEFAYSQAPASMKALCQSAWLLTVAFGNLVVVIIAESSIFENQAYEFFFFAASIEVVCLLFAFMSYFYKYVDPSLLSPSFTATDLRVDQDGLKNGRENRPLVRERESPPPPYYGDDTMATSDVDDPPDSAHL